MFQVIPGKYAIYATNKTFLVFTAAGFTNIFGTSDYSKATCAELSMLCKFEYVFNGKGN